MINFTNAAEQTGIEQLKREQEAERKKIQDVRMQEAIEKDRKERSEENARIAEANRFESENQAAFDALKKADEIMDKITEENILVLKKSVEDVTFPSVISISIAKYNQLKIDSNKLADIVALWKQADRMTDSANHADLSSVRNSELRKAREVREEAIALIKS